MSIMTVTVTDLDVTGFVNAMGRAAEAAAQAAESLRRLTAIHAHRFASRRERQAAARHHPLPLTIDGHTYHRRRKNRTRRNR